MDDRSPTRRQRGTARSSETQGMCRFLTIFRGGTVTDVAPDPQHGRFDATVFLFTCIILAPIAALGMMVLQGTVFQLSRRAGVPDGFTIVFVSAAIGALAWTQSELWVPRSLRLLGMIARAWVVSTT